MTLDLQRLVREASTELGSDACAAGKHQWESEGGRRCPKGWGDGLLSGCSQAVYRCAVCGDYDYGEAGGPGAADCETQCRDWRRGLSPAQIAELEDLDGSPA